MIKIFSSDKIEVLEPYVGSDIIKRVDQSRNYFVPVGEKKYFLSFRWIDKNKAAIYADEEHFIIASGSSDITGYAEKIDVADNGILQLHEFFLELTANDVYKIESLENMIISLEDNLLMNPSPSKDGILDIIKVRKDLLQVKRYYERIGFLTDELAAVDPTFTFISKKFDRLLASVLHLQEYIEQVREAYQAQIDIEQNSIMKVFTVVTAIFLPLSLIAGWYGMNLMMPEFEWPLGYPFVIVVSLTVAVVMLIIFKKKKWF